MTFNHHLFLEHLFQSPSDAERREAVNRLNQKSKWAWLNVAHLCLRDTLATARARDLAGKSAALAYSLILSFVPLLAIAFTFFNLFGGLKEFSESTLKPFILDYFEGNAAMQISVFIDTFILHLKTGTLGAVSFVTFFITVIGLLFSIEKTLNDIYEARNIRGVFRRILNYWVLTTLTPLVVVFSTAKYTQILKNFPVMGDFIHGVGGFWILKFVLSAIFQSLGFSILLMVLPARRIAWQASIVGGIVVSLLLEVLQEINIYLTHSAFSDASVSQIYGTVPLLAVVLFVWLRLMCVVFLAGATVALSIDRVLYLTQERRTEALAPRQILQTTAQVFEDICHVFKAEGRGVRGSGIAARLRIQEGECNKALAFLESRKLIFSVRDDEEEKFIPSHQGLLSLEKPHDFVELVLSPSAIDDEPTLNVGRSAAVLSHFTTEVLESVNSKGESCEIKS